MRVQKSSFFQMHNKPQMVIMVRLDCRMEIQNMKAVLKSERMVEVGVLSVMIILTSMMEMYFAKCWEIQMEQKLSIQTHILVMATWPFI